MSRVVVLGGGPAGLYASLLLARRGLPVTLLEREQTPGGLTAGTEVAGIPVDYGSHRLHPSIEPDLLDDLNSILGGDLQRRRRNGRIRMAGAWISFPISPAEMLTRLSPTTLARLGASALRAMLTPNRSESFAEVVSTRLGPAMGELFYFPYAEKIWGVPPGGLAGEQARRRISAESPWKLVRRSIARDGSRREFFYPEGGFGRIPAALANAARDAGADVRLGEPVVGISASPGDLEIATPQGTRGAALVLSTIPITVLARFLHPPDHIEVALNALRYRAMVLVYLVVPVRRWTEYDAHYFPESDAVFTRISEPKNYRGGTQPDDRTVICVELPCDFGDETWREDDESLREAVRGCIVELGLPDPGSDGEVHRIRHAYPIYELGSDDALAAVAGWLDEQPGVITFGRQGLFAHDNTHHALAMARDAAACISADLELDHAAWDEARRRFAEHVVED